MNSEYLDPPGVVARRKAVQPAWVTDEGRNVNGFILVGYAPDNTGNFGTPMIDPADDAYVYVTEPEPCRYCGALVSRDSQGQFYATDPGIFEPWTCLPKESPGHRHAPETRRAT